MDATKRTFVIVLIACVSFFITLTGCGSGPDTPEGVNIQVNQEYNNLDRKILHHEMTAEFFPKEHSFTAIDEVTFFPGADYTNYIHFHLNKNLTITSITLDNNPVGWQECVDIHSDLYGNETVSPDNIIKCVSVNLPEAVNEEVTLSIAYNGVIYDPPKKTETIKHIIGDKTTGTISEEGIFLSAQSGWYPNINKAMPTFNITATLPEGWEFIGQGTFAGKQAFQIKKEIMPEDLKEEEEENNNDNEIKVMAFPKEKNEPVTQDEADNENGDDDDFIEDISDEDEEAIDEEAADEDATDEEAADEEAADEEAPVEPPKPQILLINKVKFSWKNNIPSDGIAIVADKFVVKEINFNGIRIATYLFEEDASYADTYLEASKKFLDLYEKLLSKYPYRAFSVVESFFTSGYGMPSYTLLAPHVIQNPERYALKKGGGLGHEILHCWWGNFVFPDYETGNWCEGLTTYLSNYYWVEINEDENATKNARQDMITRFNVVVDKDSDYPPARFIEKVTEVDNEIGYSKTAMIFHMLRKEIGDKRFFLGLKKVIFEFGGRHATWNDFQTCFETVLDPKLELNWFFTQWVQQAGAPYVYLDELDWEERDLGTAGNVYLIKFMIKQEEPFYSLNVPVLIQSESRSKIINVNLEAGSTLKKFKMKTKPTKIVIDPNFELFRKLPKGDIMPNLTLTRSSNNFMIILPSKLNESEKWLYDPIKKRTEGTYTVKYDNEVSKDDLEAYNLFILGTVEQNTVLQKLAAMSELPHDIQFASDKITIEGTAYTDPSTTYLVSMISPFNRSKYVSVFGGFSTNGVAGRVVPIFHYARDSWYIWTNDNAEGITGRFDTLSPATHFIND